MNDFFNYEPDSISPFTLARAEKLDALFTALTDGFNAVQQALISGGTITPPVTGTPEELHNVWCVFPHLMREATAVTDTASFEAAVTAANLRRLPVAFLYGHGAHATGDYIIQRAGQNVDPTTRGNIWGKGLTVMSFGARKATLRIVSTDRGLAPYILYGNPVGLGTQDVPSVISGTDPDGIENLTILNLILRGNGVAGGHAEQNALLHVSAVSRVLVKGCEFYDFPGDGALWGSGDVGGGVQVRHNDGIVMQDCKFDGVNKNNRNAISVIDGRNGAIERCEFMRCTKPGGPGAGNGDPSNPNTGTKHPGAIDFEANVVFKADGTPTASFKIIQMDNWVVRDCKATDLGSNFCALFMPPNKIGSVQIAVPVRGFFISNNQVDTANGNLAATFGDESDPVGYDITVSGNRGYSMLKPFELRGTRLVVEDNTFRDCETAATFGVVTASGQYGGVNHTRMRRNVLERCGNQAGGLIINRVDGDTVIEDNTFIDCAFSAISFVGEQSILCVVTGLALNRNRFIANAGAAKNMAYSFARLTFAGTPKIDTLTCTAAGNITNGLDTFDQATNGQVVIPGLEVGSPPGAGQFRRGARLLGRNPAPGEPESWWNAYDSATSLTPSWKAVAAPGALPDPAADASVVAALTGRSGAMKDDGAGRYTATADGTNLQYSTTVYSAPGFEWLAAASGTSTVYLGWSKTSPPTSLAQIDYALWQNKTDLRLVVAGGLNAITASGLELGVKVRAKMLGGVLSVWKTDPQTGVEGAPFSTGVATGNYYPVLLIVGKDGSVRISKVTNG